MADLSLADTKELMSELFSRFDAVLFTAYRDLNEKEYDIATVTKGSSLEVVGLGVYTMRHIKASVWNSEED